MTAENMVDFRTKVVCKSAAARRFSHSHSENHLDRIFHRKDGAGRSEGSGAARRPNRTEPGWPTAPPRPCPLSSSRQWFMATQGGQNHAKWSRRCKSLVGLATSSIRTAITQPATALSHALAHQSKWSYFPSKSSACVQRNDDKWVPFPAWVFSLWRHQCSPATDNITWLTDLRSNEPLSLRKWLSNLRPYSAFTIRSTLADLVFLRDRKLVPLCRLLPHLLLWVLL